MTYRCPKCEAADLQVRVETWAKLIQTGGTTETIDLRTGHEWNTNSVMMCRRCGNDGIAEEFEVPEAKT